MHNLAAREDANAIFLARMLGWNQPFYLLYLWFVVGSAAWVGWSCAIAAIGFLAAPAVVRRVSAVGRAMPLAVALVNIAVCRAMFGQGSGVELFYFPCAVLAALIFGPRERVRLLAATAAPLLVWLTSRLWHPAPPIVFGADAMATLFTMHAIGAGSLTVLLVWMLSGAVGWAGAKESGGGV